MAKRNDIGWAMDRGVCVEVIYAVTTDDGVPAWRLLFHERDGSITTGNTVPEGRVFSTMQACVAGGSVPVSHRPRKTRKTGSTHTERTAERAPRGRRKNPPPGQLRSAAAPVTVGEQLRLQNRDAAWRRLVAAEPDQNIIRRVGRSDVLVLKGNASLYIDAERAVLWPSKSGKQMGANLYVRLVLVRNGPDDWSLASTADAASIAGFNVPPHLVELERHGKTKVHIFAVLPCTRCAGAGSVGQAAVSKQCPRCVGQGYATDDIIDMYLTDKYLKFVDSDEILSPEAPEDMFEEALGAGDRLAALQALAQLSESQLQELADNYEIPMGNTVNPVAMRNRIMKAFADDFEAGGSVAESRAADAARQPSQTVQVEEYGSPAVQAAVQQAAQHAGSPAGLADTDVVVRVVEDVQGRLVFVGENAEMGLSGSGAVLRLRNGTVLTSSRLTKSSRDPEELMLHFDPPQGRAGREWRSATVDLVGQDTGSLLLPEH